MKKIFNLFIVLFILVVSILPIFQSQAWNWNKSPVWILEDVKEAANSREWDKVQDTQLDDTTSRWCTDIGLDSRYTLTRTLCYIKNNSWSYLQYALYTWLTLATIFLIWNGFLLVTSSNREKQIGTFKTNLIYTVIWITLLLWFYYFIDIYVWVINLFTD